MSSVASSTEQDAASRRYEIEGRELGFPTEFRDGSSASGLFLVRSAVAAELIAESGFEIAEVSPGRAILALTGVHYTDTDCGKYEEMAFAFFVHRPGHARPLPYLGTWLDVLRGEVASYTWTLQVTTTLSRDAGLQMWGYPKTVEEIGFERSGGNATFRLRMDGQDVVSYSVRASGSQTPAPVSTPVLSIHEGVQKVGYLTQSNRDVGYRPGGGRVVLGHHPLSEQLRALGVRRRPLLATWSGHLAFSMSAPISL